ncbi:hypothetical protein GCM10025873_26550 [Demequina sediminis]|nr:hypothetical protein GCM10025873_26550 [Demequina sediminis]
MATGQDVGHPVANAVRVATLRGREPRVESLRRDRHRLDHDIVGKQPIQPAREPLRGATRRATGQPLPRVEVDVHMGDLTARVDPRIGASRDGDAGSAVLAQDARQRVLQDPLDGPQARLGGPAREVGPVVRQVEAGPHDRRLLDHADPPRVRLTERR